MNQFSNSGNSRRTTDEQLKYRVFTQEKTLIYNIIDLILRRQSSSANDIVYDSHRTTKAWFTERIEPGAVDLVLERTVHTTDVERHLNHQS